MVTREQVITALFNLVTSSVAFKTYSRKLRLWTDPGCAKPAIFLHEPDEEHKQVIANTPTKRTLTVELWIYVDNDKTNTGAVALNQIIELIDPVSGGCLKPDNVLTNKQTLGGLVQHVWIDGIVRKNPGDLDGQPRALIPLKILIP